MFAKIVHLIQKHLTDDLLKPEWRKRNRKPFTGHCYVATEGFYYLYGKDHGWKPMCYRNVNGETHWWLEKDGKVLDITAEQFDYIFDYSKGHKQFFMCYPSKRCKELVRRIELCNQKNVIKPES